MILLVIDLQTMFVNCIECAIRRDNVITCAILEIEKAKEAGEKIIILNYMDHGETHPHIAKAVEGYAHCVTLWKDSDDGADVIDHHLKESSVAGNRPKVAGMNVMYCVGDTVNSMRRLGYEPLLLWGAVEDAWATRQEQREWISERELPCRWK